MERNGERVNCHGVGGNKIKIAGGEGDQGKEKEKWMQV